MRLSELPRVRMEAVEANRNSKIRQTRALRILRDEWRMVWPDLTETQMEPSVENVYLEAAEDKAATAASILPTFDVPPRRGTRNDRAEREAEKARRVFVTLTQESRIDAQHVAFYMDWFVFGLPAAVPWIGQQEWYDGLRTPYLCRIEPRTLYPIGWNARGELTEALIIRRRRLPDLIREYGAGNPGLTRMGAKLRGQFSPVYEEIWWADQTNWATAIAYERGVTGGDFLYRRPTAVGYDEIQSEWLVEPHPHKLRGCPIIAQKAASADGEIRGKLDAMLPPLKNAHELQTEVMINLRRNMHAPILYQNIDEEDIAGWGPDAMMQGTPGPDQAVIAYPRPPIDYAGFAQVDRELAAARGAGAFPQQRSGDPGASIASGQAVTQLQGSYNAQQSWAQSDMARFYRDSFSRLANFDEMWCAGEKQIDGFDEGEAFADSYDPAKFWRGDYRVLVSFHAMGVDADTNIRNVIIQSNSGLLSRRTAIRKSGVVKNPLAEERQIALEESQLPFVAALQQQAIQGDQTSLLEYIDLVDSDAETPFSAMIKVARRQLERQAAPAPQQPQEAPIPQVPPQLLSLIGGG